MFKLEILGVIGKVTLRIPWKNLSSQPAVIAVENLLVLVGPKSEESCDDEENERRKQLTKQQMLQLEELIHREASHVETEEKDQGFMSRLGTKVVDNVQIFIDSVHVRYEDSQTSEAPFAFGITLEKLHAQSTNSDWVPSFVADATKLIFKLVTPASKI